MPEKIYASPFLRLLAGLIDQLIGLTIFLLVIMPVFSALSTEKILDSVLGGFVILLYIGITLPFLYAYLTSRFGGSLGKLVTGLKIQSESGNLISFKRSLFRTYAGGSVSMTFMGAGYFYAFIDQKRRGWHDLATGTVVVKTNPVGGLFGIVAFTVLLIANTFLVQGALSKIEKNKALYIEIFENINSEISKNTSNDKDLLPLETSRAKVPGAEAIMGEPEAGFITYIGKTYPFRFQYPVGYTLTDSTPDIKVPLAYVTLEDLTGTGDVAIITVRSEPLRQEYNDYVETYSNIKKTHPGDFCSPPMAGMIDFLVFDCVYSEKSTREAYIPSKDGGVVFNISMAANKKDKEFTVAEQAAFSQVIFSFEFTDY